MTWSQLLQSSNKTHAFAILRTFGTHEIIKIISSFIDLVDSQEVNLPNCFIECAQAALAGILWLPNTNLNITCNDKIDMFIGLYYNCTKSQKDEIRRIIVKVFAVIGLHPN